MKTHLIGWNLDKTDKVTGNTGTNTFLLRLTAAQALIEANTKVPNAEWQFLANQLGAHASNLTAEQFLDGDTGQYVGPLITALSGTATSIPDIPFAVAPIENFNMTFDEMRTVKVRVPVKIKNATFLWTSDDVAIVVTDSTLETVTLTARSATAGSALITCTVTSGSETSVETFIVTLA